MTNNIFIEALNKFKDFKVLIIGDVMIDAYLWGTVDRISPEAPVPILNAVKRENRLGGAANVALNIQSLGATPILASVIGNDVNSQIVYDRLLLKGITSEGIIKSDERITTIKTRIIGARQQMLRIDEEIDSPVSDEVELQLIERIDELLNKQQFDAIIFEDYDKGVITQKLIERVVNIANSKNIPTLVDPKKRNFDSYNNVTLFKPNFKELQEGLKTDIEKGNIEEVFEANKKLLLKLNSKLILTTLSEHGMIISDTTSFHAIPSEVRKVADVSGAGDTVISTAALCLAAGLSPKDTATLSNLAGGLVCAYVGVVPVNVEELKKAVS